MRGQQTAEISDQDLKKLHKMASLGLTRAMMASVLGFSEKTLERRIKGDERVATAVRAGEVEAKSKIAETAFSMATSGNCPAMTIFLCKTRLGWREKDPRLEALEAELKLLKLLEALRTANLYDSQKKRDTEYKALLSGVSSDILTGYIRGTITQEKLKEAIEKANCDAL
ncbi:MAG: hypothetical protein M3Q07_12935 [Pseudobdellovibrionaceae bacterium]|nr:hypothetical protein [Pseudobdellovibrionaceae bacterium]